MQIEDLRRKYAPQIEEKPEYTGLSAFLRLGSPGVLVRALAWTLDQLTDAEISQTYLAVLNDATAKVDAPNTCDKCYHALPSTLSHKNYIALNGFNFYLCTNCTLGFFSKKIAPARNMAELAATWIALQKDQENWNVDPCSGWPWCFADVYVYEDNAGGILLHQEQSPLVFQLDPFLSGTTIGSSGAYLSSGEADDDAYICMRGGLGNWSEDWITPHDRIYPLLEDQETALIAVWHPDTTVDHYANLGRAGVRFGLPGRSGQRFLQLGESE
jgi:hypothetical protein